MRKCLIGRYIQREKDGEKHKQRGKKQRKRENEQVDCLRQSDDFEGTLEDNRSIETAAL